MTTVHPFVAWNAALLGEFFSPAAKDERVLLAVGPDDLNDIAPELGGFEGLLQAVRAVREAPPWPVGGHETIVRIANRLRIQRQEWGCRPAGYQDPSSLLPYGDVSDKMPPYLPILAALVAISATHEHGQGGFYAEARKLLGLGEQWETQQLKKLNDLWDDLARWTGPRETNGKYGRFVPGKLGGYAVVGELRAQSVFRSYDFDRLGAVFSQLGLEPGNEIPKTDIPRLLAVVAEEESLSSGLREAARNAKAYGDLLHSRLNQVLEDWDGEVPKGTGSYSPESGGSEVGRAGDEGVESIDRDLGVTLQLCDGQLPWRLGLVLRGREDDGRIVLRHGSMIWCGRFEGAPFVVVRPEGDEDTTVLLESLRSSGRLEIRAQLSDGANPTQDLEVARRLHDRRIRHLVFDASAECLVERHGLPGYGPAYLLVSPDDLCVSRSLGDSKLQLTPCPTNGLPNGWHLVFIEDCSLLSEVQRDELRDAREPQSRPRVLRLVGGVRVRRAGRVCFLPYDLPKIELDAPPETEVVASGLILTPTGTTIPEGDLLEPSRIRTFVIEVEDERTRKYVIEARNRDGNPYAHATLRLAVGSGVDLSFGGRVGMSSIGATTTSEPLVSGMTLRADVPPVSGLTSRRVMASDLGSKLPMNGIDGLRSVPEVKFLDSLAQNGAGRLRYGTARDRLRRYLAEVSRSESPASILRDLRCRGMLEIEADRRGRWTAVSKVAPALYRLPVTLGSQQAWGVAGTLNFDDLMALSSSTTDSYWTLGERSKLPIVRVIGSSPALHGFEEVGMACASLANFSVSLDQLCATLAAVGFEDYDRRGGTPDGFYPFKAEWQAGSLPSHEFSWGLLRYVDPDTGAHKLHSLRNMTSGGPRYRFATDERWGTWVAYHAGVSWFASRFGAVELARWPLEYDELDGTIWLPARMNLPVLLERALVAASGSPPTSVQLEWQGMTPEGRLLASTRSGLPVGPFDSCYSDLLPPDGPRYWLGHRFVPRELIDIIATKLGCRVDVLKRTS